MTPVLFFETHWLKELHLVVVVYTWFVMALLALFAFLATRRMNLIPGQFQNVMEGSTVSSPTPWDMEGGSSSR
jgi:F0F1-type ATP synthase membrane subunit a